MIATAEKIQTFSCACELRSQGLPLELLPVAVRDVERLSVHLPGVQPELVSGVVKQLGGELEITKSAKTFLAAHGKYERSVARSLHAVMLEMLEDVQQRMIDWLTLEPTRLLPYEKWWKKLQAATVDGLTEAAMEAGKETLRRYNRRIKGKGRRIRKDLISESELSWDADGQVLIDIPPTAVVSMRAGAIETMDKDYWKKWEGSTRVMVWQKVQQGLKDHLSLMEISQSMKDSWAFDFKRAMLVARTESTLALNAGHYVMGGQLIEDPLSAVNGRQWLSILDSDTRASHTAADKQKILKTPQGWHVLQGGKMIGSGQLFYVGASRARFPGDPNLPAKERCHCRCTIGELFNETLPSGAGTPPPDEVPPALEVPPEPEPMPEPPGFTIPREHRETLESRVVYTVNNHPGLEARRQAMLQATQGHVAAEAEVFRAVKFGRTHTSNAFREMAETRTHWQDKLGAEGPYFRVVSDRPEVIEAERVLAAARVERDTAADALTALKKKHAGVGREALALPEEDRILTVSQQGSGKSLKRPSKAAKDAIADGEEFVTSLIREYDEGFSPVFLARWNVMAKNKRAFHDSNGINVANNTSVKTVVHEYGHQLEATIKGNAKIPFAFRTHRVGKAGKPDIDMKREFGYKRREIGNEDEWEPLFQSRSSAAYTGKTYKGHANADISATEIISMGLQELYDQPGRFAETDPEFFRFMMGILDRVLEQEAL